MPLPPSMIACLLLTALQTKAQCVVHVALHISHHILHDACPALPQMCRLLHVASLALIPRSLLS